MIQKKAEQDQAVGNLRSNHSDERKKKWTSHFESTSAIKASHSLMLFKQQNSSRTEVTACVIISYLIRFI